MRNVIVILRKRMRNLICNTSKKMVFSSSRSQMFFKIGVLKKLYKKEAQRRCFPVKFAKFLRTTFLQNTHGLTPRVAVPEGPALALCLAFCKATSAASHLSSASSKSTTAFLYFDWSCDFSCSQNKKGQRCIQNAIKHLTKAALYRCSYNMF